MMMQDKAILILQHTDAQAQFLGHTGFALADPFGVFLKNNVDLHASPVLRLGERLLRL
jgi:hypothetical protein